MNVSVEYSAYMRQQTLVSQEKIALKPSDSIQDLIHHLAQKYSDPFREILLDERGNLRSMILLSVNDRQVDWGQPLTLQDGDRIAILTPIAGG